MALAEEERQKAAEHPAEGVPQAIEAAFWAATGRLLLPEDLPLLNEMRRVASEDQIVRAIRLGAERAKRAGKKPQTLGYFRDVLAEVVESDKRSLGYVLPDPRDWVEVERVRQLVEAAEKLGKPVLPEWREFLREAERLGTKRPEGIALQ